MAHELDLPIFSILEESDNGAFTDHSEDAYDFGVNSFVLGLVGNGGDYTVSLKDETNDGDTLAPNDHVFADTATAAFTLNLPATPQLGHKVRISDFNDVSPGGGFGTNNLTVGRNGSQIDGDAADFVMNVDGGDAEFIYVDAVQGWRVLSHG